MAVSIVMTGTGRNCNITSGSNSMVVSSATGLVVGATIQGTGIPTGSRIGTISGTTVTMVNSAGSPATASVTNATASLIFSSVWGSILTVSLSTSGDTATMQNIYDAGFGVMSDNLGQRNIFFPGAFGIEWKNIVAGARFDFQNWNIEFGNSGYWAWEQSTILGELRGGYLQNGTQFIKSAGPTFISRNFKNGTPGGTSMFTGTATGTVTGTFRMNNLTVVAQGGSNVCPTFVCGRMDCIVDGMILDYQGDGGANAGFSAAFGTLNNTTVVKANAGIGNPNGGQYATINGLSYSGIFTDTPSHKFAIPNNYILEGYAPQVLSTQKLGGFQDNTTETFANIDLSTAGWGLNDLKVNYLRYGGLNEIRFPRKVSLEFNDSTSTNLTGVTLYIKSGTTSIINAVQSGDYSANTQALVLNWTGSVASYRVANTITDTISQVAQVRKYGYTEQSASYSLNLASYSQPFFMLTDASLSGISESTASAITTAGINWTTKTITPTANLTYDQINARIAWELAQTTGSTNVEPRSITGSNLTLATGWSLVINSGITISAGTNITYIYVPTITITGSLQGLYGTTAGNSTTLQITGFDANSAVYIEDNSATQKFYSATATGTVTLYIPPTASGSWYYAVEKYGNQRQSDFFTFSGGLKTIVVKALPDTGITVTNQSTVSAYTSLGTPDKVYDYVAYLRLSTPHISYGQIVFKNGTSLDLQDASMLINQSFSSVASFNFSTKLLTIKSTSYAIGVTYEKTITTPPETIEADTTEVITCPIEDANGDSSLTIQAAGVSTFEIWKITNATSPDDYATGTLVDTVGIGSWRFLSADGFKFVIRDTTTNYRVVNTASKGIYTAELFFGAAVQLAQSAEVSLINNKVDIIKVDLVTINNGVKKASIFVPHSQDL